MKRYEAAAQPTLAPSPPAADPLIAPAPAVPSAPAPTPALDPLPPGVQAKDLRAAFNAYDGLFNTVKRQLFLVLNNSQFRQIKAENPDARVTNTEAKANAEDTVHEFEFRLRRRPGDEEAWGSLYDGTRAIHDVRVSVGVELDGRVFVLETGVYPQAPALVQRVQLELFRQAWLWSTLGWLVVIFLALRLFGRDDAVAARPRSAGARGWLSAVQPLPLAARLLDLPRRGCLPHHLAGYGSTRYLEHHCPGAARNQFRHHPGLEAG